MKKVFEEPIVNIVFINNDVIVTSSGYGNGEDNNGNGEFLDPNAVQNP